MTIEELFWVLFLIAMVFALLLPTLVRARGTARQSVCRANLRGVGQGLFIYAADNHDWFPHHYYEPAYSDAGGQPAHGVRWAGTMGSHDFLKISEPTTPDRSPQRSHPSRSLFLLIINGDAAPRSFICPSSDDVEDPMKNVGPDAGPETDIQAAQPGLTRFDFPGYNHLSYGYQLPYGEHGKPRNELDPRMPILADKGPYYAAGDEGLGGSRTRADRRSDVSPPGALGKQNIHDVFRWRAADWRPHNSRNHNGAGQSVLFMDGSADWAATPLVGINRENIYTIQSSAKLVDQFVGMVPDADQAFGPRSETDSFIVP